MMFKKKTVLIDPEAYKKLNQGNVNNTIAHECFHWFAHRMYFKMQTYSLARFAKYCKCRVSELPTYTEEERIIEKQATAVAPRILMPKKTFIEKAEMLGFINQQFDANSLAELADFFDVSKQSARIRLEECSLI
jgi:Zn-dependent peptidase ImmA (M78 family)